MNYLKKYKKLFAITNMFVLLVITLSSCEKESLTNSNIDELTSIADIQKFQKDYGLDDITHIKIENDLYHLDNLLTKETFSRIKEAFNTYPDITYATDINAAYLFPYYVDTKTNEDTYDELYETLDITPHFSKNENVPAYTTITFYDRHNGWNDNKSVKWTHRGGTPDNPKRVEEKNWSWLAGARQLPSWMNDKTKSFSMIIGCTNKFDSNIDMYANANYDNRINRFDDNKNRLRRKGTQKVNWLYYQTGWNYGNTERLSSNFPWAPNGLNNINGYRTHIRPQ